MGENRGVVFNCLLYSFEFEAGWSVQSAYYLTYIWGEKRWVHPFPNVISAKVNATDYTGIWTRLVGSIFCTDKTNELHSLFSTSSNLHD